MKIPPALLLLPLLGCGATGGDDRVQFSSKQTPSWFVSKSATDGFVPECKVVDAGDTVQWTNQDPKLPADVTSLGEPVELYSPNLQGPYVEWAHTFARAGTYPYYDTQTGDPGRRVVDAYYGTVTWVGTSESTHRGAICVQSDGAGCCCTDLDCDPGQLCSVENVCSEEDT